MSSYHIIKADLTKHKQDIICLHNRNLSEMTEEAFSSKYESCTPCPAICYLMVENYSAAFVGTAAIFPRRIYIRGNIVIGGIAGDFSVDKEHRTLGPALILQREILKQTDWIKFVYGIPNTLAKPIFRKIGYIESGPYIRLVKILGLDYITSKRFKRLRMFSWLIDLTIRFFSRETWHKRSDKLNEENPLLFDERFDAFWDEVKDQFIIIGERKANFLNWRYIHSPRKKYEIFSLVNNENKIVGYIVYYIENNLAHIVDLLFSKENEQLESLLAKFVQNIRTRKVNAVEIRCLGSDYLVGVLKKFNFFLHKKATEKFFIFCNKTQPFYEDLINSKHWYFLKGDTDE